MTQEAGRLECQQEGAGGPRREGGWWLHPVHNPPTWKRPRQPLVTCPHRGQGVAGGSQLCAAGFSTCLPVGLGGRREGKLMNDSVTPRSLGGRGSCCLSVAHLARSPFA